MHGARPSGLQETDIQAWPILLLLLLFFALELPERLYSYDYCDSCYYYSDSDSYTCYSAVECPLVPNICHFFVSHAQGVNAFDVNACSNKVGFSFCGVLQSEHATMIQPYSGLIEGASIALLLEPVEFTNHQEV